MSNVELLNSVVASAELWLEGNYDEATKAEVQALLDAEDKAPLIDAFYRDLEFGTGGLRGIMGPGTNRMNIYTVGAATQGLSNYLLKSFPDLDQISVCIGYDCRNNSELFSKISADIFSANGIKVYLFESLRPTPEMSYAIRELGCQSGIILTASHNPKEYNGYKAYWDDGAQLLGPHDTNVIDEVQAIASIDDIKFEGNADSIEVLGEAMDKDYIARVASLSFSPEAVKNNKDLKIVYTPIHGTGVKMVPAALAAFGFENVIHVPEQDVVSGEFPTVKSPNPEEPAALELAIKKAIETDADIVMASDPDADRIGVAMKDDKGEWILVNGNQTALLLTYYMITKWKENGKITGNEYVVKTIVSTELLKEVAEKNGVESFDCYTGFKWIASLIRENEGKKTYICGGEESFGFLCQDFVRDKDAVSACSMFAEMTAWAKDKGLSLYELLQNIYVEYGYSKEKMFPLLRKGKEGADEIRQMMVDFRNDSPKSLAGSPVKYVKDYLALVSKDMIDGGIEKLDFPATSDVLQFFTEDGSKVSVRPSGTEPKIKFYMEVKGELATAADYRATEAIADEKILAIAKDLKLV
ncbi:MAG: phospho-sugar mutase [Bacteroidales bacterium]|jgi:phosphoglucomutase|nr:phospho-sugar mutase [Bacteroidales bacterium]